MPDDTEPCTPPGCRHNRHRARCLGHDKIGNQTGNALDYNTTPDDTLTDIAHRIRTGADPDLLRGIGPVGRNRILTVAEHGRITTPWNLLADKADTFADRIPTPSHRTRDAAEIRALLHEAARRLRRLEDDN